MQHRDRKSTRLNSSHTVIYTLSLHDALPICLAKPALPAVGSRRRQGAASPPCNRPPPPCPVHAAPRSEEHTSELQSHSDLHSFPTRRSSDLLSKARTSCSGIETSPGRSFASV